MKLWSKVAVTPGSQPLFASSTCLWHLTSAMSAIMTGKHHYDWFIDLPLYWFNVSLDFKTSPSDSTCRIVWGINDLIKTSYFYDFAKVCRSAIYFLVMCLWVDGKCRSEKFGKVTKQLKMCYWNYRHNMAQWKIHKWRMLVQLFFLEWCETRSNVIVLLD